MGSLHVLEVEDDGVLQQGQEDEHDARQQPDLIRKFGVEYRGSCLQ